MVNFELKPDGKRIRKRIVQRTVARISWRSNHLSIEQTEPEFNGENAETLVPQQGIGRGVVYAFCEMHNKCTKCTTGILRKKPQMSKTARKTRDISTKSASFQQINVTGKRLTFDEHGRQVGQKTSEVGRKTTEVGAKGVEVGQKVDFGMLASVGRKDFRMMCERVFKCLAKDSRMSRRRISQELGIAESTVQSATNALQEVGLLRREGRGKGSNWIVMSQPTQPITKTSKPIIKKITP